MSVELGQKTGHKAKWWLVIATCWLVYASRGWGDALPDTAPHSGLAKLYLGLCMKNLANLEGLRGTLRDRKLPALPADKASAFLFGKEGQVWPVPYDGKVGNYVLVLLIGKSFCAVLARQENTGTVQTDFTTLVAHASPPMEAKPKIDTRNAGPDGRVSHTVGYVWSVMGRPDITRKMTFILTTAESPDSPIQAMASASIGAED